MKKFISILMVLCMMLTIAPVALVSATGEGEDITVPAPYFELGFTGTVGEKIATSNLSDIKGSGATFTAVTNSESSDNAPTLKKDGANDVQYLEFDPGTSSSARTNGYAVIRVLFPDSRILSGTTETPAAGQIADYTVEFWGRLASTAQWYDIFGFWPSNFPGENQDDDFRVNTNFQAIPANRFTGSAVGNLDPNVSAGSYLNAWNHFTVTRTYDSTAGTITMSLYINGELKGSKSAAADTSKAYLSTFNGLAIANAYNDRAMMGDLASFKVYTSALSCKIFDSCSDLHRFKCSSFQQGILQSGRGSAYKRKYNRSNGS